MTLGNLEPFKGLQPFHFPEERQTYNVELTDHDPYQLLDKGCEFEPSLQSFVIGAPTFEGTCKFQVSPSLKYGQVSNSMWPYMKNSSPLSWHLSANNTTFPRGRAFIPLFCPANRGGEYNGSTLLFVYLFQSVSYLFSLSLSHSGMGGHLYCFLSAREFQNYNSKRNKTILVVGNSWSANIAPLVFDECSPFFANIYRTSYIGRRRGRRSYRNPFSL